MALGKRRGSNAKRATEELGLGLGIVQYTRSMSGKRIAISSNMEFDSMAMKKQCNEKMNPTSEKSLLEALPQDILIRVLCGVGHDDLKQLANRKTSMVEQMAKKKNKKSTKKSNNSQDVDVNVRNDALVMFNLCYTQERTNFSLSQTSVRDDGLWNCDLNENPIDFECHRL